ncbi:MAG: amino acid-binding protein [Planctomycetes bacterium]|nr:amino acid-binding protein [Planctomycetota bacterium]
MAFEITKVDVWAGEMEDRPGTLARKLDAVTQAGANLDFVIARRQPDKPGTGVVFLAPLQGAEQTGAARSAGIQKAAGLRSIRIVGPDRPGLGATIAKTVGQAGINMRGLSAAAVGDRCVTYIAFESDEDAAKAIQVLAPALA